MTPPPPLSTDLLLAHASSLRALARSLLRDAHAAEDALQETFARALERPPASLERLGAWLRAVLESVARKRLRGELRRDRRERESARGESVSGVDEGLARSEVLRRVLEAVLALDEPYREIVLDRYFEGLAPREIARRRGIPLHTVTSRLGRARGRLRERLARELGHEREPWQRALGLLFGLPFEPRLTFGAIPGVLVLSLKAKLAVAATLAVLTSLAWLAGRPAGIQPESRDVEMPALAPERSVRDETASATMVASSPSSQREAVAAPVAHEAPRRTPPPYSFPLLVELRGPDDRPLAGTTIELAPSAGAWISAGVTDARGRLALTLRGFRPTLPITLRARTSFGQRETVRALELSAGVTTGVALGQPEPQVLRLRATVREGSLQLVADRFTALDRTTGRSDRELGRYADGSAAFTASPLAAPANAVDAQLSVEGVIGDRVSELSTNLAISEVIGGQVTLELSAPGFTRHETPPEEGGARAAGALTNADGSVLAGVCVEARGADHTLVAQRHTDEHGAFELDVPLLEELTLIAGGGEHGIATTSWNSALEPELRWNPRLERGHELLGRLVDEAGEPLAGWIVEVRLDDADAPWWDSTRTRDDGRFAIPNLPSRPLQLALRPGNAPHALAHAQLDEVWPGLDEQRFELDGEARRTGSLSVQVQGGDGQPLEGCELRLVQEAGGFLSSVNQVTHVPGSYRAKELPGGDYRLVVGHERHGFVEAARFRLAPGEELDLGIVTLSAPASLHLELSGIEASDVALELWNLAPEHEACVLRAAPLPDEALHLAPGRYELVATRGSLRAARAFTLEAGERLELTLDELVAPEGDAELER